LLEVTSVDGGEVEAIASKRRGSLHQQTPRKKKIRGWVKGELT